MQPEPSPAARPVLSVVVPLFNEEGLVEELCGRILKACEGLGVPFEVIAVNDGSTDGTLSKLVDLSRLRREILAVDLSRNFGHMAALHEGLALAQGEAVVVMDGDLQDPPEVIPELVDRWRKGADVVYALRTSRGEGILKRSFTSLFYRLLRLMVRFDVPPQAGTFGLLSRGSVEILVHRMPERSRFFAGLRAWLGGRQEHVTYERPARPGGHSRVGLRGLASLVRRAFIGFSYAPLRATSALALLASLAVFLLGALAVALRLAVGSEIPLWAAVMAIIGFLGFTQGLVLFFLCEYLAVIYEEVKGRPLAIVADRYRDGKKEGVDQGFPGSAAGPGAGPGAASSDFPGILAKSTTTERGPTL